MKIKKISIILTSAVLILITSLPVLGATSDTSIPSQVIDLEKSSVKTFSPKSLESNSTALEASTSTSGPQWTATLDFDEYFYKYAYAKSESLSDGNPWPIDRIYAKVRMLDYWDNLIGSAEEENFGSYLSVTTKVNDSLVTNDHAIGNHAFEKSGYQSYYPETYNDGGW